jgi:hypothetical protein
LGSLIPDNLVWRLWFQTSDFRPDVACHYKRQLTAGLSVWLPTGERRIPGSLSTPSKILS